MQMRFLVAILLIASSIMLQSCSKDGGILGGIFDKKGETVATSDLPTAIIDYLTANYPNFSIKEAEKETDDSGAVVFEIHLESGEELIFDENGNFIGLEDDDESETESDSLALGDLPPSIQDYLSTNFADFTFAEAGQDTICGGIATIEVALQQGTTEITLVFDSSNSFLYQASEIKTADLLTAITESINVNYATYTADEDGYLLEFPDGTLQYQVELEDPSTNTELEVTFGANGTVICEE